MSGRSRFLPQPIPKVKRVDRHTWLVPAIVSVAVVILVVALVYAAVNGWLFTEARH
jgi:hypothetical protein